jgi:lipoate-protein ligase A
LPYTLADGPYNMAADEVLLEGAVGGVASLRFYAWTEATVSLGYFQPAKLLQNDPHLAGLPYVRRSSGGETLVHHHEITYALGLPAGPPWQRRGESWPCRMHRLIAEAMAELGVTATLSGEEERRSGNVLCFQHQTPGDLLVAGSKVVGSAQRKQRGALMQHGGILLAKSSFTPLLPGIAELSGLPLSPDQVRSAVSEAFTRQTGWDLIPAEWTDAERCRVEELVSEKYANPRWNDKR